MNNRSARTGQIPMCSLEMIPKLQLSAQKTDYIASVLGLTKSLQISANPRPGKES
jgi:hypothetical protein